MSWGPSLFYYHCPHCGKRFSCEDGLIPVLGDRFGKCPVCGAEGVLECTGPRIPDDQAYEEVWD
ncbi:MAG TPA: excinuclease ATPase subunit [Candidatus Enterenecus stercoripullorum]|nr:excinuclease ATPase subunit [Candidatus Enterenecus stercoripullorum]